MKHYKSERLKKLETELNDLQEWLKLGLVPKKEVEKHKGEIQDLMGKIEEEKERINFLKESGEMEEYTTPKRSQPTRAGFTEMPTLPDVEMSETIRGGNDTLFAGDNETVEQGGNTAVDEDEDEETTQAEEEESYFSDRNRWKRGGNIIDPDADVW